MPNTFFSCGFFPTVSSNKMKTFELKGHKRPVKYLRYNTEGDLVFTTGLDPAVLVWSTATGEMLGSYEGHQGAIRMCDSNYTSSRLATAGADHMIGLWDVTTGKQYSSYEIETPVQCTQFSHGDSHILAVSTDRYGLTPAVQVFEHYESTAAKKSNTPCIKVEHESVITWATFGPTNKTVYFVCDDGTAHILDVETQKKIVSKTMHEKAILRFRWDTDMCTPITASADSTAKLLDARSLDVIQTYEYERGKMVFDADIAPRTNHVIIAGGDDPQSVTNVKQNVFETRFMHRMTGQTLARVGGHFGTINTLAFHPLNKGFCTGAEESSIRLHHFDNSYSSAPGAEDFVL